MKILLVSQMYPGPTDPDLGVFVRGLEEQLMARGHQVERAVLDRRGGSKVKYLRLGRATSAAARRVPPAGAAPPIPRPARLALAPRGCHRRPSCPHRAPADPARRR